MACRRTSPTCGWKHSTVGFASDYNFSGTRPRKASDPGRTRRFRHGRQFTAGFGLDSHTFQLDPLFVAPAAGDFHLRATRRPSTRPTRLPGLARCSTPMGKTAPTIRPWVTVGSSGVYADRGALEYETASLTGPAASSRTRPGLAAECARERAVPIGLRVSPNPARVGGTSIRLSRQGKPAADLRSRRRVVRKLIDASDRARAITALAWDLTDRGGDAAPRRHVLSRASSPCGCGERMFRARALTPRRRDQEA